MESAYETTDWLKNVHFLGFLAVIVRILKEGFSFIEKIPLRKFLGDFKNHLQLHLTKKATAMPSLIDSCDKEIRNLSWFYVDYKS